MLQTLSLLKVVTRSLLAIFVIVPSSFIYSQCTSNVASGSAVLPYANGCQDFTSLGSGMSLGAQVHNGGVYTFSLCNSGGNWPGWNSQLTGYNAGVLFYNDDACGQLSSATWTSTLTGTINIGVNRFNCAGFQGSGAANSATLTYCCAGSGDPNIFGSNEWRVYVYNVGDGLSTASNWSTAYSGYYTVSSLNFNTTSFYSAAASPSSYASYLGCEVGTDNHSWTAKRTGFSGCSVYQIDIPVHDDYTDLWVNGTQIFSQATGSGQANVWTGVLNSSSTVELRLSENAGSTQGGIAITPITPPALDPGAIGFSQTLCSPADPAKLTETAPVSGGVGPSYSGGSYTYSWRYRDNCSGGYSLIAGANGPEYDPPGGLTATRCYERGVTDACGNTVWSPAVTITVTPLPVVSTVNVSNVLCNGGGTGSISVVATSGTGSYEYSIDDGLTYQPSSVFNGLSAGPYTVRVRDQQGCTSPYASNPVVVGQPASLTIDTSHIDASCANVYDGSITITPGGGTAPYSYSLNGGPSQISNVFNGLAAGTYTAAIMDNNGCSVSAVVDIYNSYAVTGALDSTWSVSCFGGNDGAAFVSIAGGIPPYDYSINNIIFQSAPSFTGLTAGSYIAIVRDSKGCTDFVTVPITQPSIVTAIVDSTVNGLCAGSATAGVYITPAGGTPSYTFHWSDAASSATEDLVGVPSGTYNVTVTDAHGCTGTAGSSVSQPYPLFVTVAQYNDVLCNGDSTGAIDITVNGGTPPYDFVWSNGKVTEDVSGLLASATPYAVTVTDANGCQEFLSQLVNEPTPFTASVSVTSATCSTGGSATITLGGGVAPYTVLWSNGDSTTTANNLTAGGYTVTATDVNGCQKVRAVNIPLLPPLELSVAVTQISCNNANNGAIDLTVVGGTPGYGYQWNDFATTQDRTGLGEGHYCVTVTDNNGCTASICADIYNPAVITISMVAEQPLCNVANGVNTTGRITGSVTGGTPNYTFTWSDPYGGGLPRNNVAPGTYRLTITDVNGCTSVDSVKVIEPDAMAYNVFTTNVSCNGNCDGRLDITPYGGVPPYSYNWSNGGSTQDLVNVCPNNYSLTITDDNGCTVIGSLFSVTEPAALNVSLYKTDVACQGGNTGVVGATVTGGRTPYTYLWTNGPTPYAQEQTNIGGGNYCVSITDSTGCQTSGCINVAGQPNPIYVTPSVRQPTCGGGSDGFVSVFVTGGQPPYGFNWNTSTPQNGNIATNLGEGTYVVTISDATGCSFTDTVVLQAASQLSVTASTANLISCQDGADGVIVATATNGTQPYLYSMDGISQASDTFRNVAAGTYVISVRDVNGCEATTTAEIVPAGGTINVDLTADRQVALAGQDVHLTASAVSDSPIVQYVWQPSIAGFDYSGCVDTASCSNPTVRLTATTTIIVTVINEAGCAATDTLRIEAKNDAVYFFPTAFTPNGDGLNDRFEFDVLGSVYADVKIWNRWGELIFANPQQPNGISGSNGWDGTYKGKKAQFDTYTYQIVITFADGHQDTVAGTITIMQ